MAYFLFISIFILFYYFGTVNKLSALNGGDVFLFFFSISNGVRQGGILSPKIFLVYIDDLSDKLVKCKIGCYIDNLCMNHVMYADDICLMAPSPAAFQELIHIYYDFSVQNDLSFNSSKSYCMVFKPKSYKLSCPRLYMDNQLLKYTDDIKYLGFHLILTKRMIKI